MPDLPIRRLVIYKHGVGYFERRGPVQGTALRLSFPREAMDDVLKSLVALDLGTGQVLGVDFETPEDRATLIARGSIHLSDNRSLLDLLRDLRGRRVRLWLEEDERNDQPRKGFGLSSGRREGSEPGGQAAPPPSDPGANARTQVEGLVIGVDIEDQEQLRLPIVSIYQPEQRRVRTYGIREIKRLEVLDDRAAADLDYFLRAAQSEEDRRAATLRLSEGEHDLLVGYISPAPAWRVSYRILFEPTTDDRPPTTEPSDKVTRRQGDKATESEEPITPSPLHPVTVSEEAGVSSQSSAVGGRSSALLQGWGLFDNQLDEDLENVALTLVAGMPVSFRYRLYEPHTPERPLVSDEERTVAAPVSFGAMPPPMAAPAMAAAPPSRKMRERTATLGMEPEMLRGISMDTAETSTLPVSTGEERGALFQYRVAHPVSVARGQSAMVPIVGQRLDGRKDLLYNSQKLPRHPVASLRMRNETGLTLERGPVTVIEDGDYAGEAVLPFTRTGGELIVPYAVELGITVTEEQRGTREIGAIGVREDYLLIQEWDIQHTTYRINSTLSAPVTVMVEQALLAGYQLTETDAPAEQAQGLARWPVACPPARETTFTVRQRRELSRREHVRGLAPKQLREFLRRRFLDEATYQALAGVLDIYAQIETHSRRIQELNGERQHIYEQQRQIQGSLSPLGRDGEEGALRARYIATLGELEDRLAALAAEEQRLKAEIARLEEEASKQLAGLASS